MSNSNLFLANILKDLLFLMTTHHLDISSNVTSFYLEGSAPSLESFLFAGWQVLDQFDLRTINYQNLNNMRKHTNIKSGRPPQWISITAHQHEEGHQYRKWLSKSFHSNLICFLNLNENGPTDRERKYAPCFLGKSKTPWLSSKVITGKPSWLWSYQRCSHHCPFSGTRALLKITKPAANVTSHWGT